MGDKSKTIGAGFILPTDDFLPDGFAVSDLTDEHKMVRNTIREFMENEVLGSEAIKKIEGKDWDFTRRLLTKLGELGILGAEVPEVYGGSDMDKIVSAIVAEEVGREGSFAATVLAHTGIGMGPIRYFGNEEQKTRYLPKLASANSIAAYSLTESQAGSDVNSIRTTATRTESGYILNGEKIFLTNGRLADVITVFAKLDGEPTAFIVERSFDGVKPGKEEHKLGIQGSSTTTLVLDGVRVPRENLLGKEGGGKEIAYSILNLGRFKLGAACLGGARLCLLEALGYATERKQFDSAIVQFGAIREKLARMAAGIYAMESVIYGTAGKLNDSILGVDQKSTDAVLTAIKEFAVECSLVKVFCSETMFNIAYDNVRIHGGNGFMKDYPAERHLRDAVINTIFEGTNEINRLLLVGVVLKRAAKGLLPLMAVGKKIGEEILTSSLQTEPDDVVERLHYYLNNAKKAVILVSGSVWEKYGIKLAEANKLPQVQILMLGLADLLIDIYVMENCLAAFTKDRSERNENLVRLVFMDRLFNTDRLLREVLPMCAEGDTLRIYLAATRRLLKFTPDNRAVLCDNIVNGLA